MVLLATWFALVLARIRLRIRGWWEGPGGLRRRGRRRPPRADRFSTGASQGTVKIHHDGISRTIQAPGDRKIGSVIEDVVAALVGLSLLFYLGYALARPERL